MVAGQWWRQPVSRPAREFLAARAGGAFDAAVRGPWHHSGAAEDLSDQIAADSLTTVSNIVNQASSIFVEGFCPECDGKLGKATAVENDWCYWCDQGIPLGESFSLCKLSSRELSLCQPCHQGQSAYDGNYVDWLF